MQGVPMPKINPETRYSDIIIPTMDLVRGSFLVHLLMTNSKKVQERFFNVYRILVINDMLSPIPHGGGEGGTHTAVIFHVLVCF